MKPPFREHHLLQILDRFDEQKLPLDVFLRDYFRSHKAIGSHDRKSICEKLYALIRWKGLIDTFCEKPLSWKKRLEKSEEALSHKNDPKLPPHIRVSFPKWYYEKIAENFGEEEALKICLNSNTEARPTIRVNTLKTSREALQEKWKDLYPFTVCERSLAGIRFKQRINFFSLPEFKEGLFEVQDEASQIAANLVDAKPGDQILDYCAGSGGKTLAFAPQLKHTGQIYLHDIRPHALLEAKKRLKRAGIQNAQILMPDSPNVSLIKAKMDWVFVDAPCSGSGTLRRNPDMKWKFAPLDLDQLIRLQKEIVEKAVTFLKKGGKLVYATCSIFLEENENQIASFTQHLPLKLVKEPFRSFPEVDGMDGFFAAVLEYTG